MVYQEVALGRCILMDLPGKLSLPNLCSHLQCLGKKQTDGDEVGKPSIPKIYQ